LAISSSTRKAGPFLGNDATTVFPFAFKVFTSADLRVVRTNALGVESDLVLDTDYTVALNSNQDNDPGGTVTRATALPTGERLTITSDVEALQPLVLTNNGGFYPRVINDAFDKITIIAQQLIEQVGRSLKLPISSTASATLPDPVANRLIAWNSSANGFTNVDPASIATVAAYADASIELFDGNGTQTAFTLAEDPAVLANLDVSISGVTQVGGEDFTWIGTTLTFVVAPPNGTRIQVRYTRAIPPVDLDAATAAAAASAAAAAEDAVATAADRAQTGLDRIATAADVVSAEADRAATAADRVQTGLDRVQTGLDRIATAADVEATADKVTASALAASTGAALVGSIQTGTGATARTVQDKQRDIVSVKDFGATGDGTTDDTAAITLALGSGAKQIYFPTGTYLISSALVPFSNQTLFSNGDATISGNFADYLVKIFGFPGAPISTVTAPITVLASSFAMASVAGLAAGDNIFLYDTVLDEYDVNRVQSISGLTVTTTWPIMRAFATAGNISVALLNPLPRVNLRGFTFENPNAAGGGVRLNSSLDCSVERCRFNEVNYINISAEKSIGFRASENLLTKAGSSGIGLRVTKSCSITDNRIENTQVDEPITLYKANGFATVTGNRVAQYLSGGGSAGNSILLDEDNYFNTVANNTCTGSATYHIYLAVRSSYNTITGNTLQRANLGCIRMALAADGNTIDDNVCVGVVDATDPNDSGIASAAIRATAACAGNIIGMGNSFASNAGVNISDLQTSPPATGRVRGAMVKKAADQTAANYSTPAAIAWDAEIYDTNAIHDNSTNNTRLTVPANVTFVQLGCNLALGLVANPAIFALSLRKNGSGTFDGATAIGETGTGNPDPELNATSGPIPVTAGDYFEWFLYCDDGSITVVAGRSNAWMTLLQ
jgi:hypothetical protein